VNDTPKKPETEERAEPASYRGKKPIGDDWQNRVIDHSNVENHFNGQPQNIGVVLGSSSDSLRDVDLDCPEAIEIASFVLPKTKAIFGRPSARAAHWLYRTGEIETDKAVLKFADPVRARSRDQKVKATLVELRIGDHAGAQTVFPGSTHETGEAIAWEESGDPAEVDGAELVKKVTLVAAGALLVRYWPGLGAKHDAALALGGFLARAGLSKPEIKCLVEGVARAAGCTDVRDKVKAACDSAQNVEDGDRAWGFPKVAELFGKPVAKAIAEWLGYNETSAADQEPGGHSFEDFVAYRPMHNYIYTPTREMWPAPSVNACLPPVEQGGNDEPLAASRWLDRHRAVDQMTWSPGTPMLIEGRLVADGGWVEKPGARCFNLYRPPTIVLGTAASAQPWLDHGRKVYGDDADHIVRWAAHRVQRPQEKVNHALVLGGLQGVGKDTYLEPVKYAIGPWNFQEASPQQILGDFNSYARSVILRVSEARDLGEGSRFKFYDHMKTLTAAPPDVLRVNEKFLREYSVPNVIGVILTTNYKTDGIYLPQDDRRHFVAWSDLTPGALPDSYFVNLWSWYHSGGFAHVAAYLHQVDLSKFNPKAPPPKTRAFWDIVDAGRAPEDAELADTIDKLDTPPALTLAMVENATTSLDFREWLQDRRNRRQIPHRFERVGYVPVRNDTATDGLWRINNRRQVVYAQKDLPLQEQLAAAKRLIR
jgi:hypothetical protein